METDRPIRLASRDDLAEIARLLSTLGYPLTAEEVDAVWGSWQAEGNSALVVGSEGRLLGLVTLHRMVVLHRPRPVGRITSLVVDAPARGRGIGRRLMRAAEHTLMQEGCGLLEITSHVRRHEAHTFYEHMGYERTSHRFGRNLV